MLVEIYRLNPGASRHLAIRSIRDCVEGNMADGEAAAFVDTIIRHNDVDASAANANPGKLKVRVKDDVGSTEWETFRRLFDVHPERSTDTLRLWRVTITTKTATAKPLEHHRLILASTFQLAHDWAKMGLSDVTNSWALEVQGPFKEGQILFETEIK